MDRKVAKLTRPAAELGPSRACPMLGTLRDLFLTLRTEDLDKLSELIERARLKAESLHALTAAADLREID